MRAQIGLRRQRELQVELIELPNPIVRCETWGAALGRLMVRLPGLVQEPTLQVANFYLDFF